LLHVLARLPTYTTRKHKYKSSAPLPLHLLSTKQHKESNAAAAAVSWPIRPLLRPSMRNDPRAS